MTILLQYRSKNIRILAWGASILLLLFGFTSCEDKDKRQPFLSVENPVPDQELTACDELRVNGFVSDDGGLSQILIRLEYPGSELESIVFSGELESDFSVDLKLGDRYLESGRYLLKVTVTDLSGNSNSDFIPLLIAGVPKQIAQITVASTSNSSGTSLLSSPGADQAFTALRSGINGFKKLASDARAQAVLLLHGNPGIFEICAADDLQPFYTFSQPDARDLDLIDRDYLIGSASSPHLKVIKSSGVEGGTYPAIDQAVSSVLLTQAGIYAGTQDAGGFSYFVKSLNRNSGQLAGSRGIDFEVIRLLSGGNQKILAFGNPNGQFRMSVLDSTTLQESDLRNLPETFVDACPSGSGVYILTDAGLRHWQADNGLLSGLLISGNFTALAREEISGELWLGAQGNIERFGPSGQSLGSLTGNFEQVDAISFLYNK